MKDHLVNTLYLGIQPLHLILQICNHLEKYLIYIHC